jgi:seryl-tRNA synthetase
MDKILKVDTKRWHYMSDFESLRAGQKLKNSQISVMEKGSLEFLNIVAELTKISLRVKTRKQKFTQLKMKEVNGSINSKYSHESVPVDKTEKDNVTVATWGSVGAISPYAIPL